MIDADQSRRVLGEPLHQPFGDAAPRPVFARAQRRRNSHRQRIALGQIDTQALEAGVRGFSARIVYAYEAGEGGHVFKPTNQPGQAYRRPLQFFPSAREYQDMSRQWSLVRVLFGQILRAGPLE